MLNKHLLSDSHSTGKAYCNVLQGRCSVFSFFCTSQVAHNRYSVYMEGREGGGALVSEDHRTGRKFVKSSVFPLSLKKKI